MPDEHAPARRGPRPWIAGVLSLLVPGLGQLYTWHPLGALLCWLAAQVAGFIVVALLFEVSGPFTLVAVLVLALAIHLAIVVHAWLLAGQPDAASRYRPGRVPLAATICAAVAFSWTIGGAEQRAIHASGVRAFRIPSGSMSPGIVTGDMLLVQTRSARDTIRDDEIVAYRLDGHDLLKRVAGLGGDTLVMRGGQLRRNGRALVEPYTRNDSTSAARSDEDFGWQRAYLAAGMDTTAYHASTDDWGPLVVPAGKVFVLGDDRHNSLDSRYVGFVDADSVFGRPTRIYFSWDANARAVRWGRIGHLVR